MKLDPNRAAHFSDFCPELRRPSFDHREDKLSYGGMMKSTDEKNRDDAPAMHKPVAANSRDMGAGKEKMKQNRKKLGVEEDHKTKDMEKSRPGPFPDAKCY